MKMTPTICYNTSEPMFGKSGAMSPKVTSCSFRSIAKCVVAVALTLTGLGAFAVIEDFTYDYATCTADLSEGQEWLYGVSGSFTSLCKLMVYTF